MDEDIFSNEFLENAVIDPKETDTPANQGIFKDVAQEETDPTKPTDTVPTAPELEYWVTLPEP